jgi:hypothetical protein
MALAEDLLRQASHLATYQGANPTQADLRRAVSTAYYALFHLLIEDAAQRWNGSPAAATGLERAFSHGQMRTASLRFDNPRWPDWHGVSQTIPAALQRVARSFVELQDERHAADYNNHREWSVTDVQDTLTAASAAFTDWQSVRTDPLAGDYLLSMLLGKSR